MFVGKNKLAEMFGVLGLEILLVGEEQKLENLDDYSLIFTEESLFDKLKNNYPHKLIVPLVNFEDRTDTVVKGSEESIKSTVGGEVLKNG